MKLKISHTTTYKFDTPVDYALQRVRLMPRMDQGQTVLWWNMDIDGGTEMLSYRDGFGNQTHLMGITPGEAEITFRAEGEIDIQDKAGVTGRDRAAMPLWVYQNPTDLTAPAPGLRALARSAKGDGVAQLHDLSAKIAEAVAYTKGETDATTTADAALAAGVGVCQDHAHIMIACTRLLGLPARYVSGYLFMEGQIQQEATHAWAEVWVDGLGWVGFDVSNGISPDDRYVRIAVGRDYRDAAPILGIRHGSGTETLSVDLQVQQ